MKMIERAREVLDIEKDAISALKKKITREFECAVSLLYGCKGRVVVTGMGKAGIIGEKISATLSSTGTPSLFLHPAEAIHGDLGRVTRDDVLMVISNSGETEEILHLLPVIKKIGAKLVSMVGNMKSNLAKNSDCVLDVSVKREACPLGLAPTASTTAALALGDALAVVLLEKKGFKARDFALLHPGGNIGKKLLLRVEDIMRKGRANPLIDGRRPVKDALLKITAARAGSITVVDKRGKLAGIFTDGDLRRHIERAEDLLNRPVNAVMTKPPTTIKKGRLAVEALRVLQERKIDEIPVVDDEGRPIGLVDVQDLLKAGLV